MFKKILLGFGIFIGSLIALIIIGVAVLLNWPGILINSYTIDKLAGYAPDFGYTVKYDDVQAKASSRGLIDGKVNLGFDKLCVKDDEENLSACFDKISIIFDYSFLNYIPKLKSIGPIDIVGGDVKIVSKKSEEEEKKSEVGEFVLPEIKLPKFLAKTDIYPINIEIKKFVLKMPEDTISVSAKVSSGDGSGSLLNKLTVDGKVGTSTIGLNLKSNIASESHFKKGDFQFDLKAETTKASFGKVNLVLGLKAKDKTKIDYTANVLHKQGGDTATIKAEGEIKEEEINSKLTLDYKNPEAFAKQISAKSCKLSHKRISKRKNDGRFDLNCSLDVYLKAVKFPSEVRKVYRTPDVINVSLGAGLDTFFMPDMEHKTKGKVSLKLTSTQSNFIKTSGHTNVLIKGKFVDFPKHMSIGADMDVDFDIVEFARLVKAFEDTPYEIPAPLNALQGEASISLEGKVPSLESVAYFPVVIQTKLNAGKEKIYIDAKGKAKLAMAGQRVRGIDLESDVVLTEVEVPLPSLHLASLPRMAPDARIILDPSQHKPKKETNLKYDFSVKTPEETPVKIVSNISSNPIPINLDLKLDDEKVSGVISIESFPVSLFNHPANIESLKLDLREPFKYTEVSGTFTTMVNLYNVTVRVAGTFDQPTMWFESSPPLSEQDIISVMMYGEPMDDLDTDKADSVGNMKAAMSNKALALGTFFVFASTPLEGVNYDPDTKAIIARIRLGKRTTMSVGKKDEHTSTAGIKRRLGGGWMINTSVNKDGEEGTTSGTAFFEWHKRY